MINLITLFSALLGMGGFIWLLKYEKYSVKDIQEYSNEHSERFKIFMDRFWKEIELQNKYDKNVGAPVNELDKEFFLQHRSFQRKIAITIIIIGFGLQLLNGINACLWCY